MLNDSLILSFIYVIVGLVGLAWGADRFVAGSASLARSLGVSVLLVGIVIVGFGTSAPELLVSGNAAYQGNPGLAIGNALGSNVANVALVLGVAALAAPLAIHSRILWREIPLTLVSMLIVGVVLYDLRLGRVEAILLLCLLALFLSAMVMQGRKERWDTFSMELEHAIPAAQTTGRSIAWTLIGLVVLLFSARVLVGGAVDIAQAFKVSELVIGLTIVAVGTSLPEVAAALASARKNEPDIAIGNVLGSNIFNMFGVIGVTGTIHPSMVEADAVLRDWPVMVGVFLVFILLAWISKRITRWHGALFLLGYAVYLAFLGMSVQT
ncbi:MAG: Inner membrane protein YrbG [Gammaproteobacteria bacterium]|nr:Inner membrane protein YrbG [Gammaproteobacteria bacterium]